MPYERDSMTSLSVTVDLPPDPSATERLGEWLGQNLRAGDTLGLVGDLGAGKTTLVKGLARGLELDDPTAISSPTYLLVLEHSGPKPLRHADAYLPEKLTAFLNDGGLDYLLDGASVVAVEWADRVRELLPDNTLWAHLRVGADRGRVVELRCNEAETFAFLRDLPKIGQDD